MKKRSLVLRLEKKVKRLSSLIEVNGIISPSLNLDQILDDGDMVIIYRCIKLQRHGKEPEGHHKTT